MQNVSLIYLVSLIALLLCLPPLLAAVLSRVGKPKAPSGPTVRTPLDAARQKP